MKCQEMVVSVYNYHIGVIGQLGENARPRAVTEFNISTFKFVFFLSNSSVNISLKDIFNLIPIESGRNPIKNYKKSMIPTKILP